MSKARVFLLVACVISPAMSVVVMQQDNVAVGCRCYSSPYRSVTPGQKTSITCVICILVTRSNWIIYNEQCCRRIRSFQLPDSKSVYHSTRISCFHPCHTSTAAVPGRIREPRQMLSLGMSRLVATPRRPASSHLPGVCNAWEGTICKLPEMAQPPLPYLPTKAIATDVIPRRSVTKSKDLPLLPAVAVSLPVPDHPAPVPCAFLRPRPCLIRRASRQAGQQSNMPLQLPWR